jgi:beta-lactamase superfamily II metal-dependent hydrolase
VSIYHFLKLHDTNALRERKIRRMKVKILTYKHNNRIKELEEVISGLNIKNEEIKGDLK